MLEYHVGPDILKNFIESTKDYRNERDDIEKKITQRVIIWDVDGIPFTEK